jgi:hypothetical protein
VQACERLWPAARVEVDVGAPHERVGEQPPAPVARACAMSASSSVRAAA